MRCLMTLFYQQIDNNLSISRNVSSNKIIHASGSCFFDKVILIVPFFCSLLGNTSFLNHRVYAVA